ncbi:MAG: OmpA family protein [Treponema sp.]|nr:OmpA family protein [Treponema sp.]
MKTAGKLFISFFLTLAFLFSTEKSVFAQDKQLTQVSQDKQAGQNKPDDEKLFEFKYKKDDRYRILSKVREEVSVNNVVDHNSEIVSRVSIHIKDVTAAGNGIHEANFMTTDNSTGSRTGARLTWNEEYDSVYERDKQGKFTIDHQYFMPVIRDMPIFPKNPIKKGDSWTENGYEAHDLRKTFNIKQPVTVPFTAVYSYKGEETDLNGKKFDVFTVTYNLFFDSPTPENPNLLYSVYPATTAGYSQQTLYWDYERGAIDHYIENFRITIVTSQGDVYKFRGTTEAEITQFTRAADDLESVQAQIQKLELADVQVTKDEKGLTISVENIQFKPDSAILEDSEKLKLNKIAEILKKYPNNDLLITGHTALAGTKASRAKLSNERAQSVADYLLKLGVKDTYHIFTQGLGAERPIAPNSTEEGKKRNRRVEITILDK